MSTESKNAASPDFGRAVEVVGIVGIIVSLVFLGYELKRANDIAETEAVATIYGMTNEMGLAMAEWTRFASRTTSPSSCASRTIGGSPRLIRKEHLLSRPGRNIGNDFVNCSNQSHPGNLKRNPR